MKKRSNKSKKDVTLSKTTGSSVSREQMRLVDLFCGCGGLSRGLERTGRFITTFGVDIHKASVETFIRNHGTANARPSAHLGDIRDMSPAEIWQALKRFGITKPGQLECLVGGPPCEGFSRNKVYVHRNDGNNDHAGVSTVPPVEYREQKYWQAAWSAAPNGNGHPAHGRAVRAYNPFLTDPRNFLFRSFLDIADLLRPKIILIENVRQMLSHADGSIAEEIISRLAKSGYRAEARVLNTADFGVPQLRQRAFFVAVRQDLLKEGTELPWPKATHSGGGELPLFASRKASANGMQGKLPGDCGHHVTVEEAIRDLPPSHPESEGNPQRPATEYPPALMSKFRRFVRSRVQTPANHVHRTPSKQVIDRLRAMKPGMKPHQLPPELQTRKYYYNAYGRLEWDRPANTITKSFIYPGSGKFGHPTDPRVISYREAARLQSFDDDFEFYAGSQEGVSHMIGSAVPPLLGYRFGMEFVAFLDRISVARPKRAPSGSATRLSTKKARGAAATKRASE